MLDLSADGRTFLGGWEDAYDYKVAPSGPLKKQRTKSLVSFLEAWASCWEGLYKLFHLGRLRARFWQPIRCLHDQGRCPDDCLPRL